MQAVLKVLAARSLTDFANAKDAAEAELRGVFSEADWGLEMDAQPYTDTNYKNLWENELAQPVKDRLTDGGVDLTKYKQWLGGVHYVSVALWRKTLFEHYQSNRGWRVLLLSLPSVYVGAAGIASHYQNAQAHNRLAEVSNLLFAHAKAALANSGHPLPGRPVTQQDWDGTGLFTTPLTAIDSVNLEGASDGVVRLKYVRTTTVKKVIASFITLTPLELSGGTTQASLTTALTGLEASARELG